MGLVQELVNVNSPLDVNAEMGGENLADKTHHEPSELVLMSLKTDSLTKDYRRGNNYYRRYS